MQLFCTIAYIAARPWKRNAAFCHHTMDVLMQLKTTSVRDTDTISNNVSATINQDLVANKLKLIFTCSFSSKTCFNFNNTSSCSVVIEFSSQHSMPGCNRTWLRRLNLPPLKWSLLWSMHLNNIHLHVIHKEIKKEEQLKPDQNQHQLSEERLHCRRHCTQRFNQGLDNL